MTTPQPIGRGRLVAEAVHMLALGLWLGGLGVAGMSAGRIFRTMRELDPALPGYSGFSGDHWAITAGHAVLPLFFAVDVVQFLCVLVAGATFAAATGFLGLSLRRWSTFMRAFLLLGLIAVVSYRFFALQPGMMTSLMSYWSAAAAGDTETALRHKGVFDSAHVLDRRLMMATMLMVLGAIVATIWSLMSRGDDEAWGERARPTDGPTKLEVPLLARK